MAYIGDKKISFSPQFHITEGGADYNEGYTAGFENGKNQGYDNGKADGIEQGKQAEYDAFWDAFQKNGERSFYYYAFAGDYTDFNDETYNPKYDILANTEGTATQGLFWKSPITDTKVTIYANKSITAAFYSCKNLKTIRKLVMNKDTTIGTAFYYSPVIEDITIEGEIGKVCDFGSCDKLTKKTIIHLVSVLSDKQADTVTFSKKAVNTAFETTEGLADGSTSEEWLSLVNSKPNWSFSLY